MKVCDRHHDRKAVDSIHVRGDDQHLDVCDECKFALMEMLTAAPKRRGRPPKEDLAEAN